MTSSISIGQASETWKLKKGLFNTNKVYNPSSLLQAVKKTATRSFRSLGNSKNIASDAVFSLSSCIFPVRNWRLYYIIIPWNHTVPLSHVQIRDSHLGMSRPHFERIEHARGYYVQKKRFHACLYF